ncbi:sodium/glutamate symporter [Alkaliphilus metalliredigens QYMF]|uniref:Sodium/glutamate symporter n=1 Tax=Alkaliphilus metalliredigens (strain QYMF) TaxID=293826 RepID=A6TLC4_ALKMQ|nr:sodium/glutamate symporter [Alkaliphilus metalliredigens]ABR46992.1 sodium/glutamate symporter [Alkaliphilus metalliredigens QYMF]
MLTIKFDMTQTLFIAVLLLLSGNFIRSKVTFLLKYCIPGPVIGGLIFSVLALVLRQFGIITFSFDTTLQQFFMNLFFTASGFGASMILLKKGGRMVVIFLGLAAALAIFQNITALGLSKILGVEPMIGLMTGSIPMTGGHGNAAAFAPIAEQMGYQGALTVAVAAATFGLVAGSMLGGPVANNLIEKKGLFDKTTQQEKTEEVHTESGSTAVAAILENKAHLFDAKRLSKGFYLIFIGLGLGSILHIIFKTALPTVTLPIHVMGMLGGVIMRITLDIKKIQVPEEEIDTIGNVCLGVFVSMAVYTMRLWELAELALPLIILLFAQVLLIFLFVRFITFNVMGRNYDAAVICAGHIGFGMGAVPVSMANMKTVSDKFAYSKIAFFVVPIIGGLFSNFTNAAIITFFMNATG